MHRNMRNSRSYPPLSSFVFVFGRAMATMTAQAPDIAPLIYTVLSLALGLAALLFYHRRKQFAEHAAREQRRLEQQQSQPRAPRVSAPAAANTTPTSTASQPEPTPGPAQSVQPTRDQLRDIRQAKYAAAASSSSSLSPAAPSPSLQPPNAATSTASKSANNGVAAPAS